MTRSVTLPRGDTGEFWVLLSHDVVQQAKEEVAPQRQRARLNGRRTGRRIRRRLREREQVFAGQPRRIAIRAVGCGHRGVACGRVAVRGTRLDLVVELGERLGSDGWMVAGGQDSFDWLKERVDNLRERVLASEGAVVTYQEKHGLATVSATRPAAGPRRPASPRPAR